MILKGVKKRYQERLVLDGIDLEIEEGKITAILGESGAGKTTLLNLIAGFLPFEGEIEGLSGEKPKRREGISYLFQEGKLLPNLSVEENLKFVLPKAEWEKILPMLSRVGLSGREHSKPSELSGGEKQRVAIARAFLFPHKLLLMDEPFSSLDLSLKRSLIGLVRSLHEEHKSTVLFVTHDVREAVLTADRAIVLKDGKLQAELEIKEPFPRDFLSPPDEQKILERALLGEKF